MNVKNYIFILLIVFLISCSSSDSNQKKKDELIVGTGFSIGKITPDSKFGISSNLAELVYSPLFKFSKKGTLVPVLAEKIFLENDNTKIRFILKDVNAGDVKKSFENSNKNRKKQNKFETENRFKIEVISPDEVVFYLSEFDRYTLMHIRQTLIKAYSSDNKSTGDFTIIQDNQNYVKLKRKKLSNKKVNYIIVKSIPIQRHAIRDLVSGKLDLLIYPNEGDYDLVKDIPNIKISYFVNSLLYMMMENQQKVKSTKNNINWGILNFLIDKDEFVKIYGDKLTKPANYPIPTDSFWYDSEYNKKNSVDLGYEVVPRKKKKLTFLDSRGRDERVALLIKRKLQPFGIDIEFDKVSSKEFQRKISVDQSYDLGLIQISLKDIFLDNYLFFHSTNQKLSSNMLNYENEIVDSLLDKARYESSSDKAKEYFVNAMKIILEDPPGIFLFWVKIPILYSSSCEGFDFESPDFFLSLKDVQCTEELH